MKVSDVMIRDVKSCQPGTTLHDIALIMWNNDCGSIPITDESGKLVSIITDRDIAMGAALKHKPLWEVLASEVTGERPVYSCNPSDDIHIALEIMQYNEIRRLPVVNDTGKLEGILSLGDVIWACNRGTSASLSFSETLPTLKSVFTHH